MICVSQESDGTREDRWKRTPDGDPGLKVTYIGRPVGRGEAERGR